MNLKGPFFSIIMPIYNGECYLEKAINSVLEQTYQNFELILVNDGSTDNSLKICENFSNNESRIKIVNLVKNGGVSNARNEGIKHATGVYITYFDADDYIEKNLLEVGFNKINEFNRPDAVKFGLFEDYYGKEGELLYSKTVTSKQCYLTTKEEIINSIRGEALSIFGYVWNTFYKVNCVKKLKIKFKNMSVEEDFFFNLEFFDRVKTVLIIDKAMYHYAKRENESLSSKYIADYFAIYTMKIKKLIEIYRKNGLKTNTNMEKICNLYCRYIYSMLERNMSEKSPYNSNEQRAILERLYNEDLFKELIPFAKGNNVKEQIMFFLLKRKLTKDCFGLTKFIHIVKRKLPMLFNRLK